MLVGIWEDNACCHTWSEYGNTMSEQLPKNLDVHMQDGVYNPVCCMLCPFGIQFPLSAWSQMQGAFGATALLLASVCVVAGLLSTYSSADVCLWCVCPKRAVLQGMLLEAQLCCSL